MSSKWREIILVKTATAYHWDIQFTETICAGWIYEYWLMHNLLFPKILSLIIVFYNNLDL